MWARIDNDVAVEVTDIDPAGRYHPAIAWQPVGADCRPGARWDGAAWVDAPLAAPATSVPAPLDMAQLKAAKNDEINAARLAANFSHFEHAGKLIACDQLSRSDIDGTNGFVALYGALPPGWPGGWKAIDNTYVAIADVAAWKAFYASMFAAGNANFARAQALKDALAAATTAEEVAAIGWDMEAP